MDKSKIKKLGKDLNKAYENIRKFAEEQGKAAFVSLFGELFDKHPHLQKIVWTQYTPHFNDGDVCEFGVGEFYVYIDGDDLDENFYDYEVPYRKYSEEECSKHDWAIEANARYDRFTEQLKTDIREAREIIPTALFEEVFGDGVKVSVTRFGIEVEEYDHD